MKIRTLQWNIGGGKIRDINSDPTKEIDSVISSYSEEGLDYIITNIKELNVDIITLQETHSDKNTIQAEVIARKLGLPYWVSDKYDDSHIENGQDLCQSIISKYPISQHSFELFKNPLFEITVENGSFWVSHNKGYTSAEILLSKDRTISVGTLHLVPFVRFKREYHDPKVLEVLKDVSEKIIPNLREYTLIQGDFNIDDKLLKTYLPEVLSTMKEIETIIPTTPKDRRYDHVLYKGLKLLESKVDENVLTDHYPIISEFDII